MENDKLASTIFDFMIYSEDAKEREEAKNDMIEFYKSSSENEKAVNKAYKETKKDLEGLENTEEYARLLEINKILGIEEEIKKEEKKNQSWVSKLNKKEGKERSV